MAGLASGSTYVNIHTTAFPGGEIRGFLNPVPVPPTILLMSRGFLGIREFGRQSKA